MILKDSDDDMSTLCWVWVNTRNSPKVGLFFTWPKKTHVFSVIWTELLGRRALTYRSRVIIPWLWFENMEVSWKGDIPKTIGFNTKMIEWLGWIGGNPHDFGNLNIPQAGAPSCRGIWVFVIGFSPVPVLGCSCTAQEETPLVSRAGLTQWQGAVPGALR